MISAAHSIGDVLMGMGRRSPSLPGVSIVPKTEISLEYRKAIQKFVDKLTADQNKALATHADHSAVTAFVEPGRRYDKIVVASFNKGHTEAEAKVRYFVSRDDGAIYGPKSPQAPNEKRFFGTVYNAAKWDWSKEYGVNVSDDTVEQTGAYGDCIHYERKSA